MKKSNKKDSSLIIKTPTSLTKVGNSLELTNKILTKYSVRIIPYRRHNKWYLYDLDTKVIISTAYDSVDFLDNQLTSSINILVQKNGLYAIIMNESNPHFRNWYSTLIPLRNDDKCFIVCNEHKFGLINQNGETIIPHEYDLIEDKLKFRYLSSDGFLRICKNGFYGLISIQDYSVIIPPEYDVVDETGYAGDDNVLKVRKGDKIGIFDLTQTKILFLGLFEDVSNCNYGICSVKKKGKWVLFNYLNNSFINNECYDLTTQFINGFAYCRKENNHFLVYETGKEEIIPIKKTNKDSFVHFKRFDNILIGEEAIAEHKQNGNVHFSETTYVFHVFRGSTQLSKITHKKNSRWCSVKLNQTGLIEILEAGKYGGYYPVKYFNVQGQEVDKDSILNLSDENIENQSTLSPGLKRSSYWRIDNNKLYYNHKLVFEHPDGELSANLSLDFPKLLAIVDVDPEFGVTSDFVGYIDQIGNMYWEGWSWDNSSDNN